MGTESSRGQPAPDDLAPVALPGQRLPSPQIRTRLDQRPPAPLHELRRLRAAAGLTAREAAALLGTSRVQISHIESGLTGVSEERLRRLASHYACTDDEFVDTLVAMATDRTRGWWEEYRGLLPTSFLDLSELDHHSSFLREVSILFVIHEAALRIRVSDRATSRAQLNRLLDLSEADHITLRVVPFDLDGFSRASSTMTYAGGPVPKLDTVVRDAPHGSVFIDSEAQLNAYRTRFRKVKALALAPERSRDLIRRLAKEL